jgi:hypothetical protein
MIFHKTRNPIKKLYLILYLILFVNNARNKDAETIANESKIKLLWKIIELLDGKASINQSLRRQILLPTYTISFAIGSTTIISS